MNNEQLMVDICARYKVSPQQAEVVITEEDCVVIACPGSGKTRTVGTRLAHKLKNWRSRHQGIAVISFTNVAAKEIADRLESLGSPRTLPFPHFLGTINSFFDRFLFMPHAHRAMCPNSTPKRPQLVLPHNEDWVNDTFTSGDLRQRGMNICDFHYQVDGNLIYQNPENRTIPDSTQLRQAKSDKRRMACSGYATHTDAMYWTMVLVRAFPEIAEAVSGRFAEVIIDEFQDTSAIQLEILKALFGSSTGHIMFVGDPDQSIYGFNAACPEILHEPGQAFARKWSAIELTNNYRSSQAICSSACQFRSRTESDNAQGEFRDFGFKPVCFSYPDGRIEQSIEKFSAILEQIGVPLSEGTVLTRKNATVRKLLRIKSARSFPPSVGKVTRRLALAAYFRDSRDWANAEGETEHALLRTIFDRSDHLPFRQELGGISYREWKQGIGFLLNSLPRVDLTLGNWLSAGRNVFTEFREVFPWSCKQLISAARLFPNIGSADRDCLVSEFIETIESDCPFEVKTIHQAKGETHAAVMVVGSPRYRSNSPSDVCSWFSPEIENGLRIEEVRCAFVAFTRARKVLVIAVPQSAWGEVLPKFLESGFVEI